MVCGWVILIPASECDIVDSKGHTDNIRFDVVLGDGAASVRAGHPTAFATHATPVTIYRRSGYRTVSGIVDLDLHSGGPATLRGGLRRTVQIPDVHHDRWRWLHPVQQPQPAQGVPLGEHPGYVRRGDEDCPAVVVLFSLIKYRVQEKRALITSEPLSVEMAF